MAPSPQHNIPVATKAEIEQLRTQAERELGVLITPVSTKSVTLSPSDQAKLFDQLRAQGFSVTEVVAGKADLGYIARHHKFEEAIPCIRGITDPKVAEHLMGQHILFHSCNALALNLRYGVALRAPDDKLGDDTAGNVFFMSKTLHEDDGKALTRYGELSIIPLLQKSGIAITDRMRELDKVQVLLAVDIRGYGELSNRLNRDIFASPADWVAIAPCPPPKKHIHILGRVETPALPPREAF